MRKIVLEQQNVYWEWQTIFGGQQKCFGGRLLESGKNYFGKSGVKKNFGGQWDSQRGGGNMAAAKNNQHLRIFQA